MDMIAPRVTKVDFSMLNDRVVPIGNINSSVWSLLDVNWSKCHVTRLDQFAEFAGGEAAPFAADFVTADAVRTEIVGDQIALPLGRQMAAADNFQTAQF